jgi:hypothetical protein
MSKSLQAIVALASVAVLAAAPAFAQSSDERQPDEKTRKERCLEEAGKVKNPKARRRAVVKCGVLNPAEPSVAQKTNLLPLLGLPAAALAAGAAAATTGSPSSP